MPHLPRQKIPPNVQSYALEMPIDSDFRRRQSAHLGGGPATATVTLGSTAVQLTSGWCETNAAGYSVAIGTQLFGSPSPAQEPDMLNILANPTTGSGSIGGVVGHKHWLLIGRSVAFGAGKMSGTFTGSDISGAAVNGSFTC